MHLLLGELQKAIGDDKRIHLMGHSFGCIVVTAMAAGRPDDSTPQQAVNSITLVQGGGTITLSGPFGRDIAQGVDQMSNRVYIVCTNFTVASNGLINADQRGYATTNGPIFGEVALRYPLIAAAVAAGLDLEDARRVSSHDLRHAAITDLVSRPGVSLGGAAYLAGHRHVSTTALYSHPGRAAAEEALRARIGIPSRDTKQSGKRRK